jgi:hypothetical protein
LARKAHRDHKAVKALKEIQVFRDRRVQVDHKDHKEIQVLKDQVAQVE